MPREPGKEWVIPQEMVEAWTAAATEIRRRFSLINLSHILHHYDRVSSLIDDDEDPADRRSRAQAELSRNYNGAGAVMMTCGFVEESLWILDSHLPERRRSGSGLSGYKPTLRAYGIQVGEVEWWDSLNDGFVVRHCLIHAHGRMSLMRPPQRKKLESLASEGRLGLRHDRILIGRPFVGGLVAAAVSMVDEVAEARR